MPRGTPDAFLGPKLLEIAYNCLDAAILRDYNRVANHKMHDSSVALQIWTEASFSICLLRNTTRDGSQAATNHPSRLHLNTRKTPTGVAGWR